MRAIVLDGPGSVTVVEQPEPVPGPGEVLVRVSLLGLCGTDLHLFDGTSNYLRDGYKSYPFVPGHEWTGTVIGTGPDGATGWLGARVSGHNFRPCRTCARCRAGELTYCPNRSELGVLGARPGAAAELIAVPVDTLERIPDGLSDVAATLLEPTAAAMRAVSRVSVSGRDRVAVVGAGTLGLAAAQIVRARGAVPTVFDPSPDARVLAESIGLPTRPAPDPTDSGSFDVVIEASGGRTALVDALALAGSGARIAQLGTPHAPADSVPVADLVIREITVAGVLSGVGHWAQLITLVEQGLVELDLMLDRTYPLERVDEAFARLADGARARPKVMVSMPTIPSDHSVGDVTS